MNPGKTHDNIHHSSHYSEKGAPKLYKITHSETLLLFICQKKKTKKQKQKRIGNRNQ